MKRWGCGLLLLVLLVAGAAAWWLRDDIVARLAGVDEPVEVSPEAADRAESKLVRLMEDGEEARLSGVEISSLLRYRGHGLADDRVFDPVVHMAGDTLRLTGTVATDSLPSHPELNAIRPLLPERAPIEVTGHIVTLAEGRAGFEVGLVEFAGLPIPEHYYPDVLRRVGRRDEPGLAPHAIGVRLPPGVGSARIEDGYLILRP